MSKKFLLPGPLKSTSYRSSALEISLPAPLFNQGEGVSFFNPFMPVAPLKMPILVI